MILPLLLILIAVIGIGINFNRQYSYNQAFFTDGGLIFSAIIADKYWEWNDNILVITNEGGDCQVKLYCSENESALLQKGDIIGVISIKYSKHQPDIGYIEYMDGYIQRAGGFYDMTD